MEGKVYDPAADLTPEGAPDGRVNGADYLQVLKDLGKYSYSGKELDEDINLYYFNARFYDATSGRFINVDPIQNGAHWYVYCSNNPLSMVDPTGLEKEALEQAGRVMELGSSLVETIIGIVLAVIPEPATTATGVAMLFHGGLNSASAGVSTVAYEQSDGNTELSTSTVGLATQLISKNAMIKDGMDPDLAADKAAMYGAAGDLIDGALSLAMPSPDDFATVAKIATGVNIAGDADLALTGDEDVIVYDFNREGVAVSNPDKRRDH